MQQNDIFGDDDQSVIDEQTSIVEDHPTPDLDYLKQMFREAASAAELSREKAFEDGRYYHGPGQLDARVREKLRQRGQPPIYYNRIQGGIASTLGILDSTETTAEAIARNENGEDAAVIATQIIRYLADKTRFNEVKRIISKDVLMYGVGAAIVEVQSENNDAKVSGIPYDEFYYDPCSRKYDFKDASYLIRAKWWDSWRIELMYPKKAAEVGNFVTSSWDGIGPWDKPELTTMWLQPDRRRVLVVELYHVDRKTGTWMRTVYCHCIVLEHGPTGYLNDKGKDICPIEAMSYEVDQDNQRYGMIRNMAPVQHSINARMSKMLHLTNDSRVRQVDLSTPVSSKIARQEAAKADGCIPFGYEPVSSSVDFQANQALLAHDIQMLETLSPNPALLGRAGGANTSGRAHQILQQAGFSELSRVFDRFEELEERLYRQMWWRAQQFMTDTQKIRITDDAGVKQKLQINVPIAGMVQQPVMGQDGQPVMQPVTDPRTGQPVMGQDGQPQMQPQMQMQPGVVGMHNALVEMDVDIEITTVRNAVTIRQEAVDAVFQTLAKAGISPLDPSAELIIEMSEIPDKAWVLAKYESIRTKAQQQQAAAQAPQQQVAQAEQQQNMALTQSKTAQHNAQAQKDQAMAAKHAEEARLLAMDHSIHTAMQQAASEPQYGQPF